MTSTIQCDYEEIEGVAATFQQEADGIAQMLDEVRRAMEALRAGEWTGTAARRFYAEMDQEVLPATQRLVDRLADAATVSRSILIVFQEAEEEAAALFIGDTALHVHLSLPKQQGTGISEPPGGPPVPVPGAPPGTIWRPVPPAAPGRRVKWVPRPPIKGQAQPSASWDPDGHWDVDNGFRVRQRYDKEGNPLTPEQAHDPGHETVSDESSTGPQAEPAPISEATLKKIEQITGLTGAALIAYIIVSEGLRILFPPRNLVPLP